MGGDVSGMKVIDYYMCTVYCGNAVRRVPCRLRSPLLNGDTTNKSVAFIRNIEVVLTAPVQFSLYLGRCLCIVVVLVIKYRLVLLSWLCNYVIVVV